MFLDTKQVINDCEYSDTEIDIGQKLEGEAENDMNQPVDSHEEEETSRLEADLAETNSQEKAVEPNEEMDKIADSIISDNDDQKELVS